MMRLRKKAFFRRSQCRQVWGWSLITLIIFTGFLGHPISADGKGGQGAAENPRLSFGVLSDLHLHEDVDAVGRTEIDDEAERTNLFLILLQAVMRNALMITRIS